MRILAAVGSVVIGVVLAGCGGDGPQDGSQGTPTPPPGTGAPADPGARLQASTVLVEVAASGREAVAAQVGVVVSPDGHVVTVGSVIAARGGAPEATVTAGDGRPRPAEVLGTDPRTSLAVLRVAEADGLVPAVFADAAALAAGDRVLVVGGPQDPGGIRDARVRDPSVVAGAVSTVEVDTAAPGGGVVGTPEGELLGFLVTSVDTDGVKAAHAVPADLIRRVADQIIAGGPVTHPYLGVALDAAPDGGAAVRQVADGSPAADAGLRPGDVLVRVGGVEIDDPDAVVARVQAASPGERLAVAYLRDGTEQEVTVTLAALPPGGA
ncbi:MAG TPA: PDZ domain-containing protein [Natronosporangium sp.]|nr:PDZ domain-containing protein [Natronosporangium sp.]